VIKRLEALESRLGERFKPADIYARKQPLDIWARKPGVVSWNGPNVRISAKLH
ncbi:unnamed protein product, partial [marine sediment metagenome]